MFYHIYYVCVCFVGLGGGGSFYWFVLVALPVCISVY